MAKGQISKTKATETILKAFPGSFTYDKEIRIPFVEDGEQIQLKCVLTCAKINVNEDGDVAIPGETSVKIEEQKQDQDSQVIVVPTQEEKDNVARLAKMLGL